MLCDVESRLMPTGGRLAPRPRDEADAPRTREEDDAERGLLVPAGRPLLLPVAALARLAREKLA